MLMCKIDVTVKSFVSRIERQLGLNIVHFSQWHYSLTAVNVCMVKEFCQSMFKQFLWLILNTGNNAYSHTA